MFYALIAALAVAAPIQQTDQKSVEVHELQTFDKTISGQPVTLPPGPVRITISEMTLPVGARLPPHYHPFARLVHVLEGHLDVKELESGQVVNLGPDDWAADVIGAWHEGVVVGPIPVRLLLIEQTPEGQSNTFVQ